MTLRILFNVTGSHVRLTSGKTQYLENDSQDGEIYLYVINICNAICIMQFAMTTSFDELYRQLHHCNVVKAAQNIAYLQAVYCTVYQKGFPTVFAVI